MNSLFFKAIIVAIIGLGLLSPQVTEAGHGGSKTVNMSYAGSGINTQFDSNGDGLYVSLSQATGKGNLGKFAIAITAEFGPPGDYGNCHEPLEGIQDFPLVSSEAVITFANQSQLFADSSEGYLCLNESAGNYWGLVNGDYVGGTGRYSSATGTLTSNFSGQNLGDPRVGVGFRSITGTVEGTVNK
jgi:hypothetical protein